MRHRVAVRPTGRKAPEPFSTLRRGLDRLIQADSRRRPFFSTCWSSIPIPPEADVIESYTLLGAAINILSLPGPRHMYHVVPWEYTLQDPWLRLMRKAVDAIRESPPETILDSMEGLRHQVVTQASEVLRQLSDTDLEVLPRDPVERMRAIARISETIGRYTVGLGILEVLLFDDRVEDVFVDAPSPSNPIHVTLGGVKGNSSVIRCPTNITASDSEMEGLASRLRQYSGRPFSQAFPVLETDIPCFETRATMIGPPLSPSGNALALRRRSRVPWTLTRMVHNRTLDPMTSGLLSLLIDGSSTILVAGARGSGKSSLLGALMFEFPLSQRILIIEDTPELPVRQMQKIGFNAQSLVVEQGIGERMEIKTEEALRVSLRLGESAIVMGEVRGREAQTLYEGMRTGRAGSSVLGTIHGDSALTVYERVIHDMGIAPQAFRATDIIVTMGMIRIRGSQSQVRRVVEISELAKDKGPGEFNQLGELDPQTGALVLDLQKSETISRIARTWGLTEREVMENIGVRARLRESLVRLAELGWPEYLDPLWLVRSNEFLWRSLEAGSEPGETCQEFGTWLRRRSGVEVKC